MTSHPGRVNTDSGHGSQSWHLSPKYEPVNLVSELLPWRVALPAEYPTPVNTVLGARLRKNWMFFGSAREAILYGLLVNTVPNRMESGDQGVTGEER
ncbi:hypothetical protein [Klebsiella variicola]|uniref:hypothetical protein n=1 Tax=Klebsiella variicola TaxID=244366 RepID=UPI001804436E|nr:hypothetical protein [Klebsiella variicola]EFE1488231.1 hypothetical protein [Escherichia coli]MCQ3870957.1 hypothetical protein [Klebsiella variicola]